MKIGVAQLKPFKGNVSANIVKHISLTELAIASRAEAIFFPELSITGYEPELAKALSTTQSDERFNNFQKLSDDNTLTIGIGMPLTSAEGILISMIIFQPGDARQVYSKQILHADELPYFVCGNQQLLINIQNIKVALAICYESLQAHHAEHASEMGAQVYVASVAKAQSGVDKAYKHFAEIATQYSMPVLMANCIGTTDNFISCLMAA